jgi:hypothetical protein
MDGLERAKLIQIAQDVKAKVPYAILIREHGKLDWQSIISQLLLEKLVEPDDLRYVKNFERFIPQKDSGRNRPLRTVVTLLALIGMVVIGQRFCQSTDINKAEVKKPDVTKVKEIKDTDSDMKARVNEAVIATYREKIPTATNLKITRCEKGNPSKQVVDQYNPKSVYCARCLYYNTLIKMETSDCAFVIERQTGELAVISHDITMAMMPREGIVWKGGAIDRDRMDRDDERRHTAAKNSIEAIWDSSCPFPRYERGTIIIDK